MIVDAGQLRGRVVTIAALFVRNTVGIGGGVLVELLLVPECGLVRPVQLAEENDLYAERLDLRDGVVQLLPGA